MRGRARVRKMLREMDLVHVHVEPMTCPLSAGEETGDGTTRALCEKSKATGAGGEQGAAQRKRGGEDAEWDSGRADTRELEGGAGTG